MKARYGENELKKRLRKQADHRAQLIHQGEGIFRFERFYSVDDLAELLLKATFLWETAHSNIFKIETNVVHWSLPRLPEAFEGYRILQLSDLHVDIDPRLPSVIIRKILETEHDLMVITGDYRYTTDQDHNPSMQVMKPILESTNAPKIGILGNHDFIEMVGHLEEYGCQMLLNEATAIARGSDKLWIAGVDDPHFYKTHDFKVARSNVPADTFCLLLCHSPEPHAEAAQYDFDLMLSGHTHGGQICLPNGRHLVCPVKGIGKEYIKGRWVTNKMQGYTSKGTGSSGVAARLNCAPEVTLHILSRAQ